MSVIIDRRLNDRDKGAANRARFMRRYRQQIRRAVSDLVGERSIRDIEGAGDVNIPARDIAEPRWQHGTGGERETVMPGNREFETGDRFKRPPGGRGGQGGGGGEGDGEDGEDAFAFTLSSEEFMEIFFDDLELPHLQRTQVGDIAEPSPQRAGYTRDGAPVNLSVVRTMRQALGRRIALSGAARRRLAELEAEDEREAEGVPAGLDADPDAATSVALAVTAAMKSEASGEGSPPIARSRDVEREALRERVARVPFLDELDLRYRHRVMVPRPVSRAVMFCLMDVSASMDEERKDLAKRFFTLLYLFLSRKYERVEIVFIRHTDDAEEVDERHFFHDRKTGGTVVLSALTLMKEIVDARFPPGEWNVYGAQASDGDAFGVDPERSRGFLESELLPLLRFFAYIEVRARGDEGRRPSRGTHDRPSTLAAAYARVASPRFAMRRVDARRDIYPVFRDLFARGHGADREASAGGAAARGSIVPDATS